MKIFDFVTHEGYQYELCKLQCEFTLVTDKAQSKLWNSKNRPVPENVAFVDKQQLSVHFVEQHDLAIVHNWKQFQLIKECDIPKIIVMHCTKGGQGDAEFCTADLSNCYVVFNSFRDQERWNIKAPRQKVIWHGFDPEEWPISTRQIQRIFTVGRRITERGNICGTRIIQEFERSGLPVKVIGHNPMLGIEEPESFEVFKEIHSSYSCYLNPTLRSPMPRGRGEAMMCGIPIITTGFFDEELFIEQGVNGFYANNVQKLKEYAAMLLADRKLQEQVAMNARETALEKFHIDRFLTEWQEVIYEALDTDPTQNLVVSSPTATKVYITRKDGSAGGGTVTSANIVKGLRDVGYQVSCLDINSKAYVTYVDGRKLPATGDREWKNYIRNHPCDIMVFDDIDRYALCKDHIDSNCKVFLCVVGNPQVHDSCWYESGILDFDSADNKIRKIFCRPVYGRFLRGLFGEENVIPWVGGCDGEEMRHTYGTAQYKHPRDGALILSAHRGTDWWKNPNTAVLAAYGIYKRYPETVYFKPSPRGETKDKPKDPEKALLNNIAFDIQYGGTPKEGVSREELLKTMACAQLAIEPFFSEGYSRSCNEMGNLGVPVIQGSNASWYLGENDLLRKYLLLTDSSDIQEIIDKALALLGDEGLWNEVSQECVKFFSRFNIEQEVYTLLNALED